MNASKKTIEHVRLSEVEQGRAAGPTILQGSLEVLSDVKVKLQIMVGEAELSVSELMNLREKSVVDLNRDASQPVDLVLGGKTVGRGHIVVVGDKFGIQLTEINNQ